MPTLTYSSQMANKIATPPVINSQGSGLFRIPWDYTIGAASSGDLTSLDAADVVQLCVVPAGCKVILPLSMFHVDTTTTAGSIDIGHAAYKDKNNATVAAVADALVSDYDSTDIVPHYLIPLAGVAPLGTSVDALGVMDFTDAVTDIIIQGTCVNASFDGTVGSIWKGFFVIEYSGK